MASPRRHYLINRLGQKYTRPKLTIRQLSALATIRDSGQKKKMEWMFGRYLTKWFDEPTEITIQVKALKKRGLIKWQKAGVPVVTEAGYVALHHIGA